MYFLGDRSRCEILDDERQRKGAKETEPSHKDVDAMLVLVEQRIVLSVVARLDS